MDQEAFQTFLSSNKIYRPDEILDVLHQVRPFFRFAWTNKKMKYFDVPASFDIETTSFTHCGEKVAIMYEWTFGIFGAVIIGRTWEEFETMMAALAAELALNENKRLIVYVHNLAFEFQFMRKHFKWPKVFALSARTPLYALTDTGIEFRCSYLLSGYSLAKMGEGLQTFSVRKLTGSLDYTLPRHSGTLLTDEEIAYCVNDVKVVMAYITERIAESGNITLLPLTKTGYVRSYCRQSCFYEEGKPKKRSFKRLRYRELIKALTLDVDEYKQLKRAFQGGFTHANPFYSGKLLKDVTSYDFTSSYPAVMVSEKFPMSAGELVSIGSMEEFNKNLKLYCCLFDVEFTGLNSKLWYDSYISQSRCWGISKPVVNNGRIVSAEHLITTITEQDWHIIKKFYSWKKVKIFNFRRYRKDYLPTDFVKAILKLYEDKTTLKNVEGREADYLRSKEMLNSCYGMCVTDIVRDEILYYDDWSTQTPDYELQIERYNKGPGRFLFYPWGVWVTAYARRNLFTGIMECAGDYVYADTDSIKILNADAHQDYIEKYNARIRRQMLAACRHHGIDPAAITPKTIAGKIKPLGVWDFDGYYKQFKTLGAKRYMVETEKGLSLTVSGLNKKKCVPWMLEKFGKDGAFRKFSDALYVPPEFTGKMTHTYIDEERTGALLDVDGVIGEYDELSSVHLSNSDYSLSISREYSDYIRDIEYIM